MRYCVTKKCWLYLAMLGVLAGCVTPPVTLPPAPVPDPVVVTPPPPLPPPVVIDVPKPEPILVIPAPVVVQTPAKIPDDVAQLMDFMAEWSRYHELSADELKREVAQAVAAFNKNRTEANRLRLGIAQSLQSANLQDDQRALAVLEPLLSKSTREPIKLLASLIAAQIQERIKLLKDEQKKTDALQQKLDALRNIEQSLRNRRP
jgi:hypothetical protein